jgi:hypothetical protein
VLEVQWLLASLSGGRAALFYVLVLLHVVSALVGFGSIGFAGIYASRAYLPRPEGLPSEEQLLPEGALAVPSEQGPAPPEQGPAPLASQGPAGTEITEEESETEEILRYFERPARLWLALVAVPFFALGALAANPGLGGLDQAWVLGALLIWIAATLIAASLVVPALRHMSSMLSDRGTPGSGPGREAERIRFSRTATLAGRGAACCDVLFFAALALMIWRP